MNADELLAMADGDANLLDDCWNRIGVQGDHSCPELAVVIHCRNCPVFAAAGTRLFDRAPPSQWLDEQADHLARSVDESPSDTLAVLIFRLADEWLALPIANVIEVAVVRPVHSVPHRSGGLFEGLVNIRGDLQLCVSLARLLNIPDDVVASDLDTNSQTSARLIVVEHQGDRWVFPADRVAGVHRMPLADLGALPATVGRYSSHIARGIFAWDGRQVGCLDTTRVFAALGNLWKEDAS